MAKTKTDRKIIGNDMDAEDGSRQLGMTGLLSFRLHSVANMLSRGAAMRYRREFGVTLWEWRTIALVGGQPGMSLKELAKIAGLDKSQVSRVVTGLTERRLLLRSTDENDARGIRLSLTNAGQRLYQGLIQAAAERNEAILGALTQQERAVLESAMVKLERLARDFIEQEKSLGNED
ncbi:MarR family winged helix-turn-helix transcriptional regulator [Noviherbaspirillum sp.]|uniref:MarR family winged helix-turn-helix transcriptional regulator n=1 Tax=Noviherbaspirillum sp. TaxID=1926288 RepID=UPI002D267F8D|nr:MarR family transcriptional regulator [Noviherbaspirillum sp.]HZW21853.1 MarR family transcriptional regulator [Noviherbaspirillum sp.]